LWGIADFIVLISLHNFVYKISVRLEYLCKNSQAEYEAFQFGLQNLDVKDINGFDDSLLVV
jgi:hypothetical protein